MEALIILVLILLNGFFAMAEIAVVSSRKVRLEQLAREGDRQARRALELANAPARFLSTVQIGITLIGILAGAFGGATLAKGLAVYLKQIPVVGPYHEAAGFVLVVLTITYFSVVLGEIVPKRLALTTRNGLRWPRPPFSGLLRCSVCRPFASLAGPPTWS